MRIDYSSVQLQTLDGLIEVHQLDDDLKVFWSTSSQLLLVVDTESLCVLRYGPQCSSCETAVEQAKRLT
jgi:hypothetical protein